MEKFNIYTRSDGFYNSEYLNDIGKQIYNIFKDLKTYHNKYFHRVNNITVTSLKRTDNKDSSHYTDNAIDFYIEPIEYMPYYYGIIHACYPYNINLGMTRLHIHIDNSTKHNNRKGLEYTNPETKKIEIIAPTGKNIDYVLGLYDFGVLTAIQDTGLFKESTRKLYLTYYKIDDKLPLSAFMEHPPKKKFSWVAALILTGGFIYLLKSNKEV